MKSSSILLFLWLPLTCCFLGSCSRAQENTASDAVSVAESDAESVAGSVAESDVESVAGSVAESVAVSDAESVAVSDVESVAENDVGSVAENDAGSVAESDVESVAENDAGSVAESDAKSVAESDAVRILAHLASKHKWSISPSSEPHSSVPLEFLQRLSTSPPVSPSASLEMSMPTSSPVPASLSTNAMKILESSSSLPAASTESVHFLNAVANNSNVGKSEFKIVKILAYPLCRDSNGIHTDMDCHDPIATVYITCYSNHHNLSICFIANPLENFPSNEDFFSYASSAINEPPDNVLFFCSLTASLLHAIPFRPRNYKDEESGMQYDLVFDENITNICLPIFEQFGNCTKSKFLTTCITLDGLIAFFPSGCRPPATLPEKVIENTMVELVVLGEFLGMKILCQDFTEWSGKDEAPLAASALNESWPHDTDFELYAFHMYLPCLQDTPNCWKEGKYVRYNDGNATVYMSCYRNKTSFNVCLAEKPLNTLSNANFFSYISNLVNQNFFNLICTCQYTSEINYNKEFNLSLYHDIFGSKNVLIYDEELVSVCQPLFQTFGNCTTHGSVTACLEKDISVGLVGGGCKLPPIPVTIINQALAELFALKHFDEIQKICNGNLATAEESRKYHSNTSLNVSHVGESDFTQFELVALFIRPPCRHKYESIRFSTHHFRDCYGGIDTLYISCYRNCASFDICLKGKPVKSFASNEQFFTHATHTLDSHQDVSDICIHTALYHFDKQPRREIRLIRGRISGKMYHLLYDVMVSELCLPIYKYFGNCIDYDGIVRCLCNDVVITVIPSGCRLPSLSRDTIEKTMIFSSYHNGTKFIKLLCNGSDQIYEEDRNGITAVLIPHSDEVSHPRFPYQSNNFYWPCCYNKYSAIWTEDPEASGLSRHWSYLPTECRVGEIFLMTFQGVVAVTGVLGNFLVLAVMFNGGHRYEQSSFMRTSLSIADFLISAFVMVPSVFDCVSIISDNTFYTYVFNPSRIGNASLLDFPSPDFYHTLSIPYGNISQVTPYVTVPQNKYNYSIVIETTTGRTTFPFFNYANGWFLVIRGQMLSFCSCVTMIMMCCLSAERLAICWRPLKYKKLFLMYRVKRAIFLAWSFGLITSIVISFGDSFTVYWNSWAKLSFGTHNTSLLNNKPLQFISIILCVVGISTFAMSVLALVAFLREQDKVRQEREELDMGVTGDFERENLYITITLVLMAVLFLLAYLPVGINVFTENDKFRVTPSPIFMFCSWWLFLGGSAVNPFVYNFRSHIFRSELAELIERLLPESQKSKMKPYITHPRNRVARYLKTLDQERESHDGLPKDSNLRKVGLGFRPQKPDSKREEEEEYELKGLGFRPQKPDSKREEEEEEYELNVF